MTRVLISGIGMISNLGQSLEIHRDCLKSLNPPLQNHDMLCYENLIHHVEVENARDYIKNKKAMRFYGQDTVFGCVATKLAIEDAGFSEEDMKLYSNDTGLILGSTYAAMPLEICHLIKENNYITNENRIDYSLLEEEGIRKLPPLWMLGKLPNTTAGQISIENGIKGVNFSIVNGMNSGIVSIGEAFLALRQERAKRIFCGGTEVELQPEHMAEARRLGIPVTNPGDSILFGTNSQGYVFSEGACIFALTNESSNKNQEYGEILGYWNSYIPDWKELDKQELVPYYMNSMEQVMSMSGVKPEDVDFIQASAGGYSTLDLAEARAIYNIFPKSPYITAVQSYIGYTRNASGAFSTAVACLELKEGCIYPLREGNSLYMENKLNYVKEHQVHSNPKVCIVNSFTYLGEVCSLLIRKS